MIVTIVPGKKYNIHLHTWQGVGGRSHFDSSDEVIHGDLDLAFHVSDPGPQWVEVQHPIPAVRVEGRRVDNRMQPSFVFTRAAYLT